MRVLITKEEDMFVAQCLEHDICVQAPDMTTLQRRLANTIGFEAADGVLETLPAAPPEFHEMWEAGMNLDAGVPDTDVRLAA